MASKVTAIQQSRRPRDPSDEFGAGSLGSIGGSEVGSSVEGPPSVKPTPTPASSKVNVVVSTAKPIETIELTKKQTLDISEAEKASVNKAAPESTAEKIAPASKIASPENPTPEVTDEEKPTEEAETKTTTTSKTKETKISNKPAASETSSTQAAEQEKPKDSPVTQQQDSAATPRKDNAVKPPKEASATPSQDAAKLSPRLSTPRSPAASALASPRIRRSPRKRQGSVDFTLTSADGPPSIGVVASFSTDHDMRIVPGPPVDPLPSIHAALSSKNSSKILPSVSASLSGRTKILPTMNGLPPADASSIGSKSQDSTAKQTIAAHVDALPSMDSLPNIDLNASPTRVRSSSSVTTTTQGKSLDQLDALGQEAREAAAKFKLRKRSLSGENSNGTSSQETMTSQNHRYLVEALMDDGSASAGAPRRGRLDSIDSHRDRLNSFDMDFEEERLSTFHQDLKRERLNSLEMDFSSRRERLNSLDMDFSSRRERLNSLDMDFSSRRERLNSLDMDFSSKRKGSSDISNRRKNSADTQTREKRGRDRCESWGGMSDLSIPLHEPAVGDSLVGGGPTTAVQLAASIYTSLANDLTAAANPDDNESISSFLVNEEKIPSKISVQRDRADSTISMSTNSNEIGKLVKDAMDSMGDTLAEIANAATEAAKESDAASEASSALTPVMGGPSDHGSKGSKVASLGPQAASSTALSVNLDISVDYDAVAAAVDAAEAAAGAIDLTTFAANTVIPMAPSSSRRKRQRTQSIGAEDDKLSVTGQSKMDADLPPIPESKMDEEELAVLRERARAAAGYIPPAKGGSESVATPMPPKKKVKLEPETPAQTPSNTFETPKTTNSTKTAASKAETAEPATPASSVKTPASKGQSSQKWDSMFDCLLQFIDDRRIEETAQMSEEEKKDWIWDGNVPTTFKTKDGKALGRWVNNQRSAKSKGVLKEDREKRLVDAGLKWSVLASNSWNEMLEELRIYVADQTKAGRKWDGNVPTNYRIKTRLASGSKDDEDKNLGRWVNRQRSLYSAGKLRKDRQKSLEEVGLKWSMLATTSWESMFETLCEYVESKTKGGNEWDGNVPANYKTTDSPPRALGRWINRQRSAYGKDKLKPECVAKLNKIGLKWSVHERRPTTTVAAAPPPEPVLSGPDPVPSASTNDETAGSKTATTTETPKATNQEAKAEEAKSAEKNDSKTEEKSEAKPDAKPAEAETATKQEAKPKVETQPEEGAKPAVTQEAKSAAEKPEKPEELGAQEPKSGLEPIREEEREHDDAQKQA